MRLDSTLSLAALATLLSTFVISQATAAVLSGSVVENLTSRPLARARVTLEPRNTVKPVSAQNVWTLPSGQYSFDSLPAGAYVLRAAKTGYATVAYGQRQPDQTGSPIVLQADSHFSAELRLPRLGAVTGEVLDENQIGLPGIPVFAFEGGRRLKAAAITRSDDTGAYRLAGLKPGRYSIRTGPARLDDGLELLPTYFPQAASAAQSTRIQAFLDREAAGININPLLGHLAAIEGRVLGAGTDSVLLLSESGRYDTRIRPGGGFRFDDVEPGAYTLMAESAAKDRVAFSEITVGKEDTYATLEMQPAPALHVNCASSDGAKVDLRSVSVFLRPLGVEGSTRVPCGEKLTPGPGHWQFAVLPPPQYYLVSILDSSRGDDAHEFVLKPAETREITVLLGSRPASVVGKVSNNQGDPASGVMVFLKASSAELSRRVGGLRSQRGDESGVFRFVGLPPGGYEIIASYQLPAMADEEWSGGLGQSISLEEGQEATLNLPLTTVD